MFRTFERWLVYPAPRRNGDDWVATDLPHQDVHFPAVDGTQLHGWFVPGPTGRAPRAAILFCHGNGEHVARLKPVLQILRDDVGAAVFAWDYRSYGKSQGKPDENNTISDARQAQLELARRAGIEPQEVVVLGRSLGGGVAVALAAQYPVRGLVLDRTFSQLVETAQVHFPWLPVGRIMRNRYPSIERIQQYHGPLLQTHGTDDEVIPFEMGRRLFEAAPTKDKRFIPVEGGTHNSPPPPESFTALKEFLDALPQ